MAMKYILPLLSVYALYAIFFFSLQNGLQGMAEKSVEAKTLPGTTEPLRTVYTGVEPIDELLAVLTTFFWPALDGSTPALMLHTIGFAGTFGAAWVLVTLESWRRGNKWTIAAFPMVFGLAAQVLTFAFATPLYCGLQLMRSVTARRPNAENVRIPRAVLNAIPLIFVVAFMVPSALCIVPAPARVTVDLKQIFISLWHPWPAYVAILLTLVHLVCSPFTKNDTNVEGGRATLKALRRVYAFAFANAAISHLITATVSLATVLVPMVFDKGYGSALHPFKVYDVALPWLPLKVESIPAGVHIFLRWDYLIGSAGVLLWTLSLYATAHRTIFGSVGWFSLATKVTLLTVLTGPAGAAVELMWERDEVVIHETGGLTPQVSQQKKSS